VASHRGVRRLLLGGMGLCYVAAFLSLAVQVEGLIGARGIVPNAQWFAWVSQRASFADAPSLCFDDGCSDATLLLLAWGGALAGALLAAGVVPLASAFVAWCAYLSLSQAGQVFLSYQWDALLLEAGFLALWLAPPDALAPRSGAWQREPPRVAIWLFRFLLFRLMWGSGLVKLTSGDPSWWNLTALAVHYETQPLPAWTSWWVHQLPLPLHKLSTLATLAVELIVPLGYLAPRRVRLAAAAITAALMLTISATGNYGFFNALTLVLCLSLLDDAALPARWRSTAPALPARRAHVAAAGVAAAALFPLGLAAFGLGLRQAPLREPLLAAYRLQHGFQLASPYGLFAVMTTERPEITVEGSRDGVNWTPYALRWKPGDPQRPPRFAGFHMPRLDWQLWFAALDGAEPVAWLRGPFLARLLEGAPEVLELLAGDPFAGSPPRSVRVRLDDYRFTTRAERAATGAWWRVAPGPVVLERSRLE
jgi:hypothetical protein